MTSDKLTNISVYVDRRFWRLYFLYCIFLVAASFLTLGWLFPDEHSRVIEAAHYIAYGFATLPWEFSAGKPMVSFLLGTIHAPLLMLTKPLHLSGLTDAALLRAFSGLVCSTRLIAFHWLQPLLRLKRERRGLYTAIFALSPFAPVMLLRTSQENWATTTLLWSVFFLLRSARARDLVIGGALLALAASFRQQVGPSAVGIAIVVASSIGWRRAWPFLVGGLAGLLPLGVVDLHFIGVPFKSAWNYLQYALTNEEGGELWGSSGPLYYVVGLLTSVYPPFSVVLFPLAAFGMSRRRILSAIIIPFTIVQLFVAHKELRYFSPMLPFFALSCYIGFEHIEGRAAFLRLTAWWRQRPRVAAILRRAGTGYAALTIFIAVSAAIVPLNPSPRLYDYLNQLAPGGKRALPPRSTLTYVADSRSGISLFYFRHPETKYGQVEMSPFLSDIRRQRQLAGYYAIYRIDTDALREVEGVCRLDFVSVGWTYRRFLDRFAPLLRKRDVDAVVYCPPGRVFLSAHQFR